MRKWLAKQAILTALATLNATSKKYLSYQTGLQARRWIEESVIRRLARLAAKTTTVEADDHLVAFMRGLLKSGEIARRVDYKD